MESDGDEESENDEDDRDNELEEGGKYDSHLITIVIILYIKRIKLN